MLRKNTIFLHNSEQISMRLIIVGQLYKKFMNTNLERGFTSCMLCEVYLAVQ